MQIFSSTTESFIKRVYPLLRTIIQKEMRLEVRRFRFVFRGKLMPLGLTVFRSKQKLGYYDPHNYQIGLNERLIWEAKELVLKNILRHEMAHYMATLVYGDNILPHGEEFQQICCQYSWGPDVSMAQLDLIASNQEIEGDLTTEKLISKVKKLLELATSSNQYEAELATLKANQIILQHNLDLYRSNHTNSEQTTFLKRILFAKKNSPKMHAIYDALSSFQVGLCFNSGREGVYLEAIGSLANVEMAEYIAIFLDREMEQLWQKAKLENPLLQGLRSKNSFFIGIGQALARKNKSAQKTMASSKELILLEQNLEFHMGRAYPRLRRSSSGQSINAMAKEMGRSVGEKIAIRGPIQAAHSHLALP